MKGKIVASLMIACLPWLAMAQSNDDLYYVPKKETKKQAQSVSVQRSNVEKQQQPTTVYTAPVSTVAVKDVSGNVRNIDEYNRRYTSRDNTFSMQNDTLYVEEKPYNERGEWVNGFEGSQSDYEYAMRIIRFRSPRYAIPVSSPLYWDIVYGGAAFPSWDWNVYEDGLYAYVFPTSTNPIWWDWRWNWSLSGPRWGFGWGWSSPWYYSSWYSPYYYGGYWGGWYGNYWGGYWGGWYGGYPHYPGHHHVGHYAPHYSYNSRKAEVGRTYRNEGRFNTASTMRPNATGTTGAINRRYDNNGRTGGRVVSSSQNNTNSVRRTTTANGRNNGTYTRSSQMGTGGSTYNRPSSTRANSYRNSNAYQRMQNGNTGNNRNSSNYFNRSNSSSRSSGSMGSFRSSGSSSGSSSRSVGTGSGGGGGARRR